MTLSPAGAEAEIIELLGTRHSSIAVAESLTGGLVCATLVGVPGASAVVRGGVVAYAAEVKRDVLGVDAELLSERGTIDAEVALAMARGVAVRLGADVGLATTGNAGPDASEDKPVGRVHIAIWASGSGVTQRLDLQGTRAEIREQTVGAVLDLAVARLREDNRPIER